MESSAKSNQDSAPKITPSAPTTPQFRFPTPSQSSPRTAPQLISEKLERPYGRVSSSEKIPDIFNETLLDTLKNTANMINGNVLDATRLFEPFFKSVRERRDMTFEEWNDLVSNITKATGYSQDDVVSFLNPLIQVRNQYNVLKKQTFGSSNKYHSGRMSPRTSPRTSPRMGPRTSPRMGPQMGPRMSYHKKPQTGSQVYGAYNTHKHKMEAEEGFSEMEVYRIANVLGIPTCGLSYPEVIQEIKDYLNSKPERQSFRGSHY